MCSELTATLPLVKRGIVCEQSLTYVLSHMLPEEHLGQLQARWRCASKSSTPRATDTFKLDTAAAVGMFTR